MTKNTRRLQKGFTLIELLTVIAIIGILAAIIIPTVGTVQEKARRTADGSNVRQIVQACSIFANDNSEKFPGTTIRKLDGTAGTEAVDIWKWAGAIAKAGVLTDASFYFSKSDDLKPETTPTQILNETKTGVNTAFSAAELSVEVVAGLKQADVATTPIIFTRGLLSTTGKWDATRGAYKADGGYIGYIGGNVAFVKDTLGDDGTGILTSVPKGAKTYSILKAIRANTATSPVKVYSSASGGTGSSEGVPTVGEASS
ncbi:MAG TPA: prepilin-type N-terminal cleavage/methylation domain-containing protein [Rariglobus sp.]